MYCYRWSIALQGASIQRYCYRPASSLLASVGLHSAEPAIVRLSLCRSYLFRSIAIVRLSFCSSCLFSGIAIDMLALYFPASDIALCRACYRPFIVLQELFIQLYCYRYASSLYPC